MTEQGLAGSPGSPGLVGNNYPSREVQGAVEFKYQPEGILGENVPCLTILAQYNETTDTTSLTGREVVRIMAGGETSAHGPSVRLELAIRGRHTDKALASVAEGAAGILFAVAELPPAPLPALERVSGLVELPGPAVDTAMADGVSNIHAYQREGNRGDDAPYVQLSIRRDEERQATEFLGGSPQQQDDQGRVNDIGPDTTISLKIESYLEIPNTILVRLAQTLFTASDNLSAAVS